MATSATSDSPLREHGVADPMMPRPFRITRKVKETHDTVTFDLVPADGGTIAGFAPGQFNMLYAFGIGEVPISISGDPANPEVLIHTLRAVGAVTRALCDARRGDIVGVRGPFGTAWPAEQARGDDIVLIAGGIGLAPLRPAFYRFLTDRRTYGRISLIYGARTPAELLYRRELEHWRGQFGLDVEVTVDHAAADWYGPVGVVTRLLSRVRFDPIDTTALLCGPEVMMRFAIRDLTRLGVADDHIFLSMERNMKCAIGFCGHCQFGPAFVCKDGPVFSYRDVARLLAVAEI
ncbi:MAG: FAD/NAD(P)-binding protein [Proteobacteria bacterium]|nr:FAD/NAD(P)-binding protein [Pseudomonadota bacterium]